MMLNFPIKIKRHFFLFPKLICLVALLAVGCKNPKDNKSNQLANIFPNGKNINLGQGYDSITKEVLPEHCVSGSRIFFPSFRQNIDYTSRLTIDETLDDLDGSFNVGVDVGIVAINSDTEITTKRSSSAYRQSVNLAFFKQYGHILLQDIRKNAAKNHCGDEFIEGAVIAHKVYLNMVFHFASHKVERTFRQTISTSALFGLIKGKSGFIKKFSDYKNKVIMSIDIQEFHHGERLLDEDKYTNHFCNIGKKTEIKQCLDKFQEALNELKTKVAGSHKDILKSQSTTFSSSLPILYLLTRKYAHTPLKSDFKRVNDFRYRPELNKIAESMARVGQIIDRIRFLYRFYRHQKKEAERSDFDRFGKDCFEKAKTIPTGEWIDRIHTIGIEASKNLCQLRELFDYCRKKDTTALKCREKLQQTDEYHVDDDSVLIIDETIL